MLPESDTLVNSTEAPAPIETPDRRRPGRPPGSRNRPIDKEAEKLRDKHTLPLPPGKTVSFDQMQEYLNLLTPEMWSHVSVYVYRIRPRIIRQLKVPNCPSYIDVLGQPFTLEYMIDRHGGGRYQFEVTNVDMPRREAENQSQRGHLFRCTLEIDEVRYPPKLDYEELDVNHRENMSYIQLLKHDGVLDPTTGKVMRNSNGTQSSSLNADVIREILGLVRSLTSDQQEQLKTRLANNEKDGLTKSIGDILVERMKQDDPSKHMALMSSIVTAVKDMQPKPADSTGMYQSIITMMSEERKTAQANQTAQRQTDLEYMKLLVDSKSQSSDFGQFQQVFAFAKEILSLGQRNAGERSGWDIGLDLAREILPQGLQTLNAYLLSRNGGMPAGMPGQPGMPPAPTAFDPYRNPDQLRAYANALKQQTPPAPPAAAGPGAASPFGAAPTGLGPLVQQYGILVVNAMNQGMPGYDFADYITALLGNATHAAIAGQGEEPIVQALMSAPELALFGPERLRKFTHEFIHFEELLAAAAGQDQDDETVESRVVR